MAVAEDAVAADEVVADESAAVDTGEDEASEPEQMRTWTKRDIKKLERECEQIRQALLKVGFKMPWREIEQNGVVNALGRLLVNKGIISENELNGEMLSYTRQVLLAGLQQAEEQRLAASRTQVQAVRQPGLVVARH